MSCCHGVGWNKGFTKLKKKNIKSEKLQISELCSKSDCVTVSGVARVGGFGGRPHKGKSSSWFICGSLEMLGPYSTFSKRSATINYFFETLQTCRWWWLSELSFVRLEWYDSGDWGYLLIWLSLARYDTKPISITPDVLITIAHFSPDSANAPDQLLLCHPASNSSENHTVIKCWRLCDRCAIWFLLEVPLMVVLESWSKDFSLKAFFQ